MTSARIALVLAAGVAIAVGGWVWVGRGQVPGDPVERCRGALPFLFNNDELDDIRAAATEPVGDDGCRFTGVSATGGDPEVTITVREAEASRLDFAAIYAGRPEATKRLRLSQLEFGGPAVEQAFGSLKPVDLAVDYAFDPATELMTLSEFSVQGDGFGDLRATAVMRGTLDELWSDDDDLSDSKILVSNIRLRFEDKGLLQGFFDAVTSGQFLYGPQKEAAAERVRAGFTGRAAALTDIGVPAPAVDSLVAFIRDFPSPRRPITVSADPAEPIPLSALHPSDDRFRQTLERLNLTIAY